MKIPFSIPAPRSRRNKLICFDPMDEYMEEDMNSSYRALLYEVCYRMDVTWKYDNAYTSFAKVIKHLNKMMKKYPQQKEYYKELKKYFKTLY